MDCDSEAIYVAKENAYSIDLDDSIHFIQAEVKIGSKPNSKLPKKDATKRKGGALRGRQSAQCTKELLIEGLDDGIPMADKCVDTVLTNPPFGTKQNAGIDSQFLRSATRLARKAVYSFHKRSTRSFLSKLVTGWGYKVDVVAEMKFDIPQSYKFHKQRTRDIEVDLLRVVI